ncbi:mechanosensitive ion channel domain-containing protein [Ferrimonas senticii]|uniref:mechanosensitive ion channel domain-containing protein n=1 Tax=Ferrimonas senticii TaxID=394566 RepID=UPI000425596C|nr:mechanosensitive ion channel domain-containing protein [Ferrimonas senticii]
MNLAINRLLAVGLLLLLSLSALVMAEEPTSATTEPTRLENLNQELLSLSASLKDAKGTDREALLFQLFQTNDSLREQLAQDFERGAISKDEFLKYLKVQEEYVNGSYNYLENYSVKLAEQIESSSDENKLSLIGKFKEVESSLNNLFKVSQQNIEWYRNIEWPKAASRLEKVLEERLAQRLRQASASTKYYGQQIKLIEQQLSVSPDSEVSSLQLKRLITEQRLNISSNSLSAMVTIADALGQDTSEYKRQLFETTGDVTVNLLDWSVLKSILSNWVTTLVDWIKNNLSQVLIQVTIFAAVLAITWFAARFVRKLVGNIVSNKSFRLSTLMQNFFESISSKAVWFIGILMALSQVGLDLTPVLTGFGIAGVVIGFALQDTLSNFAAGMMLLIYRPFDVGDFVFAGGVDGKVDSMSLVNTTIKTFDNQIIIVPNSKIWGDVIKNVTHERVRRVDMVFGIGYSDDVLKAEALLAEIVESHPSVLRSPEPMIKLHTLNTSSVDFIVRPWVKTDDYWDVYWDVTRAVKLKFDEQGISIPFPQQDVHLHMVNGSATAPTT